MVSENIDLVIVVDMFVLLPSFSFYFDKRSRRMSLLMLIRFSSSDRKSSSESINCELKSLVISVSSDGLSLF